MIQSIKFRKVFSVVLIIVLIFSYSEDINAQTLNKDDENIIVKGNSNVPKIALTFDDGPHPKKTDKILDILEKYGIKATFFVIGKNAELYPQPLIRASKEGHEIANHTYSHCKISRMSYLNLKKEIMKCESIIYSKCDVKSQLFRPPEGNLSSDVKKCTFELGYKSVLWTVDTLDWKGTNYDKIVNNVIKNTSYGDIILMHDYTSYTNDGIYALEKFIPKLQEMGYEFVTISELINYKAPQM